MTKKAKGFTLIELMVVMAIIAVLSVLMIGAIQLARNTATETVHRSNAKAVQTALEGDFAKNKSYCATASTTGRLTCGTTYSLYLAYNILTGLNLDNSGSTSGQCAASPNDTAKGGGRVFSITTSGYAIGVAASTCDKYTSDTDSIRTNNTTALPTF